MSRNLTLTSRAALNASATGEAMLYLVTLENSQLPEPLRATSDSVETISLGRTFVPFPFELKLAVDDEEQITGAGLTIDNIDQQIVRTIRQATTPVIVTIEIVASSTPDSIEAVFPEFELVDVVYDRYTVSGELSVENFLNEPFPGDAMSPTLFPGLF